MLKPGDTINETYRVERLLGSGGMADVYVVTHLRMPRKFALKVVRIQEMVRHDFLERFNRECEILATLKHPHIVDVVDRHQLASGDPYLVMELLEGEDLATYIARTGALSVPVALRICNQIAEALEAAHKVGVIHRDLKPSNIFLSKEGPLLNYVKVLDFGIAKVSAADRAPMTAPAALMGTPGYMAPEQARGDNASVGPATDQFALAATLYEMLMGKPAFHSPGDSVYAILERVIATEPPPLPFPQINLAVMRALSKSPAKRYPSLREFVAAVGATSHTVYGNPSIVVPNTPGSLNQGTGEKTRTNSSRWLRRWWPGLVVGTVMASLAGIGSYLKVNTASKPRGKCAVLVEPAGAQVWVDNVAHPIGSSLGPKELMTIELGSGLHRFSLRSAKDGSKLSEIVPVSVVEGQPCSLTLRESPTLPRQVADGGMRTELKSPARLQCEVLVEPAEVQVWVDDGPEPVALTKTLNEVLRLDLAAGPHRLLLRGPNGGSFKSNAVTVDVVESQPCTVTLHGLPTADEKQSVGGGNSKPLPPRTVKTGAVRFMITSKPKVHIIDTAIAGCAGEHLAALGLPAGTTIRLERSGTLAVADGPVSVLRSSFNLCVRQALARISHDLIPESATIKTVRD